MSKTPPPSSAAADTMPGPDPAGPPPRGRASLLSPAPAPTAPGSRTRAGAHERVAHELNNLLDGSMRNVALALSRLSQGEPDAGAARGQPVDRLRTASDSMRRMADLLGRWMRGGMPVDLDRLHWEDATLGDALACARRNVDPLAAASEVRLDVFLPPNVAAAPAGSIYTVLANGLRNAVEAAPQGGHVRVRGRREGGSVALWIADDGPGLSPRLPRDDQGLPQAGATTKPNGHGLGLGLCRRVAEAMNGWVRLENAPAGGALLSVRIKIPN